MGSRAPYQQTRVALKAGSTQAGARVILNADWPLLAPPLIPLLAQEPSAVSAALGRRSGARRGRSFLGCTRLAFGAATRSLLHRLACLSPAIAYELSLPLLEILVVGVVEIDVVLAWWSSSA